MSDDRVAVVVCSRDRADLLREALTAITPTLRPGDELIVVDSASTDPAVGTCATAAGATLVRVDRPGLSRARNAGWRTATAPVVLFTDDDCRPLPGWVDAAAAAFADASVGAGWGHVDADAVPAGGLAVSTTLPGQPVEATPDSDLSAIGHGANMALRRSVLDDLGGFDELLGAGALLVAADDKDVFWRTLRRGYRVVLVPDMHVVHSQWRGRGGVVRQMFGYGVGTGAMCAKRRRLAGERGLVRAELWRYGWLPARRAARRGQVTTLTAVTAYVAGVLVGLARARRLQLVADHYAVARSD